MAPDAGGRLPQDRLSDLPDAILVSILSLLRLDEAARCAVLDFNAHMLGRRDVVKAVNSILAAHPTAAIRSFRTRKHFHGGWLEELARRGIQKLSLDFDWEWDRQRIRIPDSLFACTSLIRLRAGSCIFPDASITAAGTPHLACLTEVNLFDVTISDESLNTLLPQCKALESLDVTGAGNCVRVQSPSLKVLNCDGHFDEIVIEYAPNLERLHDRYMYMNRMEEKGVHHKVEHAPKLEFMGYLSMSLHAIEIGESIFTKDRIDVKTMMPSLKTLAVEVRYTWEGYINWVTLLLKMFPCIETLCIRGHEWQREMAKFLHGKSIFLKAMEFHCMKEANTQGCRFPCEEWVREQQELLCLDSRASKDARFLFFKHQLACNYHDISQHKRLKEYYYSALYEV